MNNRRTKRDGQITHLLSTILSKVNSTEKLLSPSIPSMLHSEILDSKGARLLTKMSDRTLLGRRNDGSLPYYRNKGKIYYLRTDVLKAILLKKCPIGQPIFLYLFSRAGEAILQGIVAEWLSELARLERRVDLFLLSLNAPYMIP